MSWGFERPPLWAVITMIVSAVALAVLIPLSLGRGELSPAEAERLNAPNAAWKAQQDAEEAANAPTDILIVGDSYTAGSDQGGNGAEGWPALVQAALAEAGTEIAPTVQAAGGSGYVTPGPSGVTFPQLVEAAPDGGYGVVVFFGSRNDAVSGSNVTDAAAQALTTAKARWPEARMLVIGPPWVDGDPPRSMLINRDAVRAAADDAAATFVDPLAEGWFSGEYETLIGSDGVHPTDDGHRRMAEMIQPRIAQLIE